MASETHKSETHKKIEWEMEITASPGVFGYVLIFFGIVLFLQNFGWLDFSWSDFWRLWPLLLVFCGITVIPMKRWLKQILAIFCVIGALFILLKTPNFGDYYALYPNGETELNVSEKTCEKSKNKEVTVAPLEIKPVVQQPTARPASPVAPLPIPQSITTTVYTFNSAGSTGNLVRDIANRSVSTYPYFGLWQSSWTAGQASVITVAYLEVPPGLNIILSGGGGATSNFRQPFRITSLSQDDMDYIMEVFNQTDHFQRSQGRAIERALARPIYQDFLSGIMPSTLDLSAVRNGNDMHFIVVPLGRWPNFVRGVRGAWMNIEKVLLNSQAAPLSRPVAVVVAQPSADTTLILDNGCNTRRPGWGNSLGTVSFATNNTWVVGNQIWSDAVTATSCQKTSFFGGSAGNFNADCRSNPDFPGDLFSWCAVARFADVLCPYPWRVPNRADFIDLDIAFGGTGYNRHATSEFITDNYIARWGGAFSGWVYSGGTLSNQGRFAAYWASDVFSVGRGADLDFNASGLIRPQDWSNKQHGIALRCVRNVSK